MNATSRRSVGRPAKISFLAALFAVSAFAWESDPIREGLTDDGISPWCHIGSLDSWEGRPCLIPSTK